MYQVVLCNLASNAGFVTGLELDDRPNLTLSSLIRALGIQRLIISSGVNGRILMHKAGLRVVNQTRSAS